MRFCLFIGAVLLLASCRSSIESTTRESRDTTIAFQPPPINDTVDTREGFYEFYGGECDTAAILASLGSFDVEKEDSSYYWRIQYNAVKGKLRLSERRTPEVKTFTVENIYKETKIVKDSFFDRLGQWGIGAMMMLGLGLIFLVVTKRV